MHWIEQPGPPLRSSAIPAGVRVPEPDAVIEVEGVVVRLERPEDVRWPRTTSPDGTAAVTSVEVRPVGGGGAAGPATLVAAGADVASVATMAVARPRATSARTR